jgi:hypothetical protein
VGLRGVNTNLERVPPPGLENNLFKVFPVKFPAKNNKKRIVLGILKSSRKIDFLGLFSPKRSILCLECPFLAVTRSDKKFSKWHRNASF